MRRGLSVTANLNVANRLVGGAKLDDRICPVAGVARILSKGQLTLWNGNLGRRRKFMMRPRIADEIIWRMRDFNPSQGPSVSGSDKKHSESGGCAR